MKRYPSPGEQRAPGASKTHPGEFETLRFMNQRKKNRKANKAAKAARRKNRG
jgi:hypothetical protein